MPTRGIRTHNPSKRAAADHVLDRTATATGTLNSSLAKRLKRKESGALLGRKRACMFVNVLFTLQRPPIRHYFHATSQHSYGALDTRWTSLQLSTTWTVTATTSHSFLSLVLNGTVHWLQFARVQACTRLCISNSLAVYVKTLSVYSVERCTDNDLKRMVKEVFVKNLKFDHGSYLQGSRITTKISVRTTGFQGQIRMGHLPNTGEKCLLQLEPTCSVVLFIALAPSDYIQHNLQSGDFPKLLGGYTHNNIQNEMPLPLFLENLYDVIRNSNLKFKRFEINVIRISRLQTNLQFSDFFSFIM